EKPFVAVNCAAIPDQLLESELFGHEKGAFTGAEKRRIGRFEQCDGGTIFLDEIGDMSPIIQGKVLRLLQEQKFERVGGNELVSTNVRIIAATNRPLEQMVADGEFREDLLYRLNGFTIALPPLHQRREDIALLLEYFLRRAKSDMNRPELSGIAPQALDLLNAYHWPGNIRQLQSVVRQSLLNTTGTVIGADNLPDFIRQPSVTPAVASSAATVSRPSGTPPSDPTAAVHKLRAAANVDIAANANVAPPLPVAAGDSVSAGDETPSGEPDFALQPYIARRLQEKSTNLYDEVLEQVERVLIAKVLSETGGNQSKAADILGITRGKVRDRIAAFDIRLDRNITLGDS
ncbi:MAG: sigma-54-dependent Fis family transcriptional regulator, partial [Planctomycetales bacterium]|nr:sigma-54-dependent Fis family transcriptional regulator [Planctomycetales bacterium]